MPRCPTCNGWIKPPCPKCGAEGIIISSKVIQPNWRRLRCPSCGLLYSDGTGLRPIGRPRQVRA